MTPQEEAAVDQFFAAHRETRKAINRLGKQAGAIGSQMQELVDDYLEAEAREFIRLAAIVNGDRTDAG